jgi:DNA-binding transcriptional regulator PaaX
LLKDKKVAILHFLFSKIKNNRINKELEKNKIESLRKYLSKLKKEGFISENESDKVYLSDKGKKKLNSLKNSISSSKYLYDKKIGDRVIVISYDIPIAFNRERRILRDILRMLGFKLVHKSVWVGKVSLPDRFVKDLNKLGIMEYVEILEVTKNGTLKNIN